MTSNDNPGMATPACASRSRLRLRAAVDATGRKIEEFGDDEAARRGYLSTLKCLRRRGVLKNERLLCAAAARIGDLEALKALRAENFPWDAWTCRYCLLYTSPSPRD